MAPNRRATIVVVVEHCAAAQEVLDQALREQGHFVLSTGDREEPVCLARRVQIDLLIGYLEDEVGAVAERVRSVQPDVRLLSLSAPVSLAELKLAVDESLRAEG